MREPTRIVAIRHGETAWNVDTRMQGHIDVPLNDTGRWQASRLAAALADEQLVAVYSSDLQRALTTAQALAEPLGLAVQALRGLRERTFGEWEGHRHDEVAERWPEGAARWKARDVDFAPPGGESLTVFFARCVSTVQALAQAHAGQTIAVVAHGGVLDCLYRAAAGVPLDAPRTWQLGNASVNRLLWHDQGWALIGWNDNRHLEVPVLDEGAA